MSVISIILLLLVSIGLSAMAAAYSSLSTAHLKHWAQKKDPASMKLYPLKARGSATYITIELIRAFTMSAAFVLLASELGAWINWLVLSVIFFTAFIVLTQLYLKPLGLRLLIWTHKPLLNITNALKPITLSLGRILDAFIADEPVTLTRSELKTMLDSIEPGDTDLTKNEVQILGRVLDFSHKTVHEVMIPKSKVITIKVNEVLSPVVLDELHKTGHERFPVLGEDGKSVVGVLNMHDVMDIKTHPSVEDSMVQKIYFIDEDRDLDHVLQVFYKTKQSVFVVHNQASDMVGIISIEDVVQEILGRAVIHEAEALVEAGTESATVVE